MLNLKPKLKLRRFKLSLFKEVKNAKAFKFHLFVSFPLHTNLYLNI